MKPRLSYDMVHVLRKCDVSVTKEEICSRQTKAQYILNTVFKAI